MTTQAPQPSEIDLYFDAHCHKPKVRAAYTGYYHALCAMRLCEGAAAKSWAHGFETYALDRLRAIAEPEA